MILFPQNRWSVGGERYIRGERVANGTRMDKVYLLNCSRSSLGMQSCFIFLANPSFIVPDTSLAQYLGSRVRTQLLKSTDSTSCSHPGTVSPSRAPLPYNQRSSMVIWSPERGQRKQSCFPVLQCSIGLSMVSGYFTRSC